MMVHSHFGRAAIALTMVFALGPANVASGESVEAIWTPRHVSFRHQHGSFYSCASLQQKVERILLKVGVRQNSMVRNYRCDELNGVMTIEIALEAPVEATPENVREATTYNSQDRLIAQLKALQLPSAQDIERFPAVWKEVSLGRDSRIGLAWGDCQLMQLLRDHVFAKLSVRILDEGALCSSVLRKAGSPRFKVLALVAEPRGQSALDIGGSELARNGRLDETVNIRLMH